MGEVAQRAVHVRKIIQRGTTGLDGFVDDVLDVADKVFQTCGGRSVFSYQTARLPTRGNPGPMKGFANVDVTHADHHFLVEKRQFDRRFPSTQPFG